MFSPRWRKILRDMWGNKTRTALVVLSIAVGVSAVGLIVTLQINLSRTMAESYAATNPASATLDIDSFNDDLVQAVRRMPGVRDAEGRDHVNVQFRVGEDEWRELQLTVIPNFNDMRINVIQPVSGGWPPPKRAILLERASVDYLNAQGLETGTIETSDGKRREVAIAGVVHDMSVPQASIDGHAYGYISIDTLEWLDGHRDLNELRIVVSENPRDIDHIKQVVNDVQSKIEKGGYIVFGNRVPTPGQHWADGVMKPLLLILSVLSVFSLFLSGFLVVNTVGALLTQQTQQIGIMKAIGARGNQVMGLYLGMVIIFGVLSLLVAVPLGAVGAQAFMAFIAHMLNFDLTSFNIPPQVLVVEISAGLIVPLLAALWPIISGTRVTVREAIESHGLGKGHFGTSMLDRLLGRVRGLSRPQLISLRNTFRRRARLALTLMTLTLAGAMLISVFSVRASMLHTNDVMYQSYNMDIFVDLSQDYRIDRMQNEAQKVPGLVAFEGWGSWGMRRMRPDKTQSATIEVKAPPADTKLFHPTIIEGRWLVPGDENAIVMTSNLLRDEPDLKVGDDLVLMVGERETHWRIVGVAQELLGSKRAYVNYSYFADIVRRENRGGYAVVVTEQHDAESRSEVAQGLLDQFKQAGLQISAIKTVSGERSHAESQFNIIVAFLLIMALLLGIVGGLGLMGTMSINVLERTREIGVMRAVGASNGAILRIVVLEGVLIGLMSWIIAVVISLPSSKLMSDAVGIAFIQVPLLYSYSVGGTLIWLIAVVVLAALASFLPARSASRLTVRDVLAYQ